MVSYWTWFWSDKLICNFTNFNLALTENKIKLNRLDFKAELKRDRVQLILTDLNCTMVCSWIKFNLQNTAETKKSVGDAAKVKRYRKFWDSKDTIFEAQIMSRNFVRIFHDLEASAKIRSLY